MSINKTTQNDGKRSFRERLANYGNAPTTENSNGTHSNARGRVRVLYGERDKDPYLIHGDIIKDSPNRESTEKGLLVCRMRKGTTERANQSAKEKNDDERRRRQDLNESGEKRTLTGFKKTVAEIALVFGLTVATVAAISKGVDYAKEQIVQERIESIEERGGTEEKLLEEMLAIMNDENSTAEEKSRIVNKIATYMEDDKLKFPLSRLLGVNPNDLVLESNPGFAVTEDGPTIEQVEITETGLVYGLTITKDRYIEGHRGGNSIDSDTAEMIAKSSELKVLAESIENGEGPSKENIKRKCIEALQSSSIFPGIFELDEEGNIRSVSVIETEQSTEKDEGR